MRSSTVLETILKRVSTRKFSDKPVDLESMNTLFAAAISAPTTAMGHFYSMIRISDKGLREELNYVCGQPEAMECPEFIVFCVDLRRTDTWAQHLSRRRLIFGYTALMFATIDMTAAAQNMVIAAASLGLGTCYIGKIGHHSSEVCRILSLPQGVLPLVGLALGYPAEFPEPRPRIPMQFMVHQDRYEDMALPDIDNAMTIAFPGAANSNSFSDIIQSARHFFGKIMEAGWWQPGERSLSEAIKVQQLSPDCPNCAGRTNNTGV